MNTRKPDYYDSFKCLGGPCPDNCCIGDELVLDAGTYRLYMEAPGPFGDRLRAVLSPARRVEEDDVRDPGSDGISSCSYCLDVDGRCPFLNDENYCDIVLALGPDALGEVCATFPRTEDLFAGALEKDLMIACPETARLLLTHEGSIRYIEACAEGREAMDGEDILPVDAAEAELFDLRGAVLSVFFDDCLSFTERLKKAAGLCGLNDVILPDRRDTLALLSDLPWQHRVWPEAFAALENDAAGTPDTADCPYLPDAIGERLITYFVFRLLPWAEDKDDAAGPFLLAVFSARIIGLLARALSPDKTKTPALADLIKAASTWSKELEFSEENILYLCYALTAIF